MHSRHTPWVTQALQHAAVPFSTLPALFLSHHRLIARQNCRAKARTDDSSSRTSSIRGLNYEKIMNPNYQIVNLITITASYACYWLYNHLSIYLSIYLSVCLSIYLSIYLYLSI